MTDVIDGVSSAGRGAERLRAGLLARLAEGPDALRREGRPSHLRRRCVLD